MASRTLGTLSVELIRCLEQSLAARVLGARRCTGGDINLAFAVDLDDGRKIFVKTHSQSPVGMFTAEAHGLSWLAEAHALRIPSVLTVHEPQGAVAAGEAELDSAVAIAPAFLALEWLEPGPKRDDFDEQLGRGLAALHRAGAKAFGLERTNFIGSLPQDNSEAGTWSAFYANRRIGPLAVRARRLGLLDASLASKLDQLIDKIAALAGPPEPPARLHGDLWGGNLHTDPSGSPCLIDPAVYGGHREVDLAMMRLFGGFGSRCFDAYSESFPLAPGAAKRVDLYQLYPLLVHLNLFGAGYTSSVERAVKRYV